jgi:hypothetical protein
MKFLNKKGNVLLFIVVAMTAISALGTGLYFMSTTATFSGLDANDQNRAYQLAVAGRDYALAKNLAATAGRDFTFTNGDKFRLVISGDNITSTGIVKEGTPYEARRTITVTKTGFSRQADISFPKDIASFTSGIRQSLAGFADVNPTAATISLGQLGSTQPRQFGSVWYSGNAAQGNCQNGKCEFGNGFRAYFIFKLEREALETPQGFTFAFFNGTDNSNTSAGGEITMPELLAYGGNSCKGRDSFGNCTGGYVDPNPVVSQKGIQPPKMAIEFDSRRNNNGSVDFCNTNSRADGTRNHMAYTFWGSNDSTAAKCPGRDNSLTYDDNRHGAGGGSYPINAVASDTSDTSDYFTGYSTSWNPNWLFGTSVPAYAFRIEVQRRKNNNKYEYTIMAWIKNDCADIVCSNHANTSLDNTKSAYLDEVPVLTRTIELDEPSHNKFNTFLFGWTAAAGSASREKVTYDKFQIYFLK